MNWTGTARVGSLVAFVAITTTFFRMEMDLHVEPASAVFMSIPNIPVATATMGSGFTGNFSSWGANEQPALFRLFVADFMTQFGESRGRKFGRKRVAEMFSRTWTDSGPDWIGRDEEKNAGSVSIRPRVGSRSSAVRRVSRG